ncbi:MAG TPA: DUF2190 family protein [Planctomycetota bacterium]|nr:DUF2190 family protein [Planctomycetota bacterium]
MTILMMLIVIVLIAFVMNWIAEAEYHHITGELHIGAVATARSGGEVVRTASGRAAYVDGLNAVAASGAANLVTAGVVKIKKSTSVLFLPGQQVWWDATNNQATYELAGSFYVGLCVDIDTVAAATTQVTVDLNVAPYYDIDIDRDGFDSAAVTTAGAPSCVREGGEYALNLEANDEAEKIDMLSRNSIAITGDGIFEGVVNVIAASNAALDINVGIANATHASSADTIGEAVFVHIDGNSLNILAESDDGTTEVAATDTTKDYVLGTRFFWQIDARDPADIQLYINGANVLPASVFVLTDGTGPMKLLAHVEKSGGADADEVYVMKMRGYVSLAA